MITPRPPKKGDPFWGAKDFAWLLKKAKRKFRGGPGIRVSEKGGDVVISATGGKSWGGKGGAFLNPGFHVEDLGPTEEDGRLARIWGGRVSTIVAEFKLFKNGTSPVNGIDYQAFADGSLSASDVTLTGGIAARFDGDVIGLDESFEVEFDPTASFIVYVEVIDPMGGLGPGPINIKTISGATMPTDVGYDPFGDTDAKKHYQIANWIVAEEKFNITWRGPLTYARVFASAGPTD
jgi:hypothetical protein